MHHYCWAMIDQMRLMRTLADKRRRDYMVERVVGNLDYVINNSDTDFAFRPEIFQRRATVLRLGGRNDEALRTLRQWVDEWPKMPAAHVALIELLLTLGRKESAREAYSNALQTLEERDTLLPYAARVGAQ